MRELALHILDLLQNAAEAGATRVILTIEEDRAADFLRISVSDDGCGMDPETIQRVTDPFFTTRSTRHVGLGLPLLQAATERADGTMAIRSQLGTGSSIEATFCLSHPDRQPLGNLADTVLAFLLAKRAPELSYRHTVATGEGESRSFEFETAEMRAALGDVPFWAPTVGRWLGEYLAEGEAEVAA